MLKNVFCSEGNIILEVQIGNNTNYYKYDENKHEFYEKEYIKIEKLPEGCFKYCDVAEPKFIGRLKDDYPPDMIELGRGLLNQKVCGLYDNNGVPVDNTERIGEGLSNIKPSLLVGVRSSKLFIVTDNNIIEYKIGYGYNLKSVSTLGDKYIMIQLTPNIMKSFFLKSNYYVYLDMKNGSIIKQEYGIQKGWKIGNINDKSYILPYLTKGTVDGGYSIEVSDAMS